MYKLVDKLEDRKVKFNMKKTPLISSLVIGFCLFLYLLNNKIVNNSSYLIFFAIIILAIVVTYMTRYTTSRRQVSREIDAGQDNFKNPYDNENSSVTHGGGMQNDNQVGYNRIHTGGSDVQVLTCIKTPCSGSQCKMPNHLCSANIPIN